MLCSKFVTFVETFEYDGQRQQVFPNRKLERAGVGRGERDQLWVHSEEVGAGSNDVNFISLKRQDSANAGGSGWLLLAVGQVEGVAVLVRSVKDRPIV